MGRRFRGASRVAPVLHRSPSQRTTGPREKREPVRGFDRSAGVLGLRGWIAETVRRRLAPLSLRGCGCEKASEAQPKVAQAIAGETASSAAPRAKAVRGRKEPSGSLAAEGMSGRESSGRSRGAGGSDLDWSLGAVPSNGGHRAGRPVTRCQRPRARWTDSEENAER